MNHEMMTYQARQDFIDLHSDLFHGKQVTLAKYDQIARELKKLDDLNFDLILDFVSRTDGFDIRQMWQELSTYINQLKSMGEWPGRKEERIGWKEGKLYLPRNE
jgi:hypothetical protein